MGKNDNKEIEKMPTFVPDVTDINPVTLSKLSEPDRLMHNAFMEVRREISIVRQENRWLAENLIESYNRGLRHDHIIEGARKRFMGIPIKIVMWVITGIGGAGLAIIAENWWKTKK